LEKHKTIPNVIKKWRSSLENSSIPSREFQPKELKNIKDKVLLLLYKNQKELMVVDLVNFRMQLLLLMLVEDIGFLLSVLDIFWWNLLCFVGLVTLRLEVIYEVQLEKHNSSFFNKGKLRDINIDACIFVFPKAEVYRRRYIQS